MLRLALVALIATSACRISLEDDGGSGDDMPMPGRLCKVITSSATCVEADNHQNLAWIEQNIFTPNCGGNSCHGNVPTPGGRVPLSSMSYAQLVNAESEFAPGRKLVVANNVKQSYLMVLLRHISLTDAEPSPAPAPPMDPGYMPQGTPDPICCQKLDAIARWIERGAPND